MRFRIKNTRIEFGFPFAVTEDNAEIIKAKALSRLTKQQNCACRVPVLRRA